LEQSFFAREKAATKVLIRHHDELEIEYKKIIRNVKMENLKSFKVQKEWNKKHQCLHI
jgi:hypothetical protein